MTRFIPAGLENGEKVLLETEADDIIGCIKKFLEKVNSPVLILNDDDDFVI